MKLFLLVLLVQVFPAFVLAGNDSITIEELNEDTKELKYFQLSAEPIRSSTTDLTFFLDIDKSPKVADAVYVVFSNGAQVTFYCSAPGKKDISGFIRVKQSLKNFVPSTKGWRKRAVPVPSSYKYTIRCNY